MKTASWTSSTLANMQEIAPSLIVSLVIVYYVGLWYCSSSRLRGLSLPPGPKGKWVTGNIHQLAKETLWLQMAEWSKIYGPLIYVRVLNKKMIFLNSAKVALDLLDSRSSIYSDRPVMWMMGELAARKLSVFRTQFTDPRFKVLRRLLQDGLNPRAARSYQPIQMEETQVLLNALVDSPQDFPAHIRRNAVAVIIKVAYGYQIGGNDDPIVRIVEEAMQISLALSTPGKYWVEFMPFLRFIPSWLPGANFKRVAQKAREDLARVEAIPFELAKSQILSGDYIESFTSKHLLDDKGLLSDPQKQHYTMWTGGALYIGGGDTTVSALTTFFLVMALYPEVQRKAQADIEKVAPNRLPTFDDYDSLPYIKAMIREIARWGPVAPLGLPHSVMEDDVYQTYFIPKGTTVIGNIWAIAHDADVYPNPFHFDPARYLGENPQPDPFKFVFGFGRRICPGAHLAEMSLFFNISNILAVFDISKAIDKEGREVEPKIEWSNGVTSHLKGFDCQIKPRSDQHLLLVDRHNGSMR